MNVLSLFDGMSCGQLALNRIGIKYEKYFASEIDKYAITVTQSNFPNTIQLGDIRNIKAADLPQIDLLIGGSPCQGFSFAGKQLNFEDERSKLFFEYVRLLNELKPKYFLLENVKMKQEYEDVISKYLGIAPIEINSNLVSAQNRRRLYWTNIGAKEVGLFGELVSIISQPKDKNIFLKDIIENEVDEKYFLSEKMINGLLEHNKRHIEEKNQTGFNWKPKYNLHNKANTLRANSALCPTDNTIAIKEIESFTIRKNVGANFTKNSKSACLMARGPGDDSGGGPYIIQKEIKQINQTNLKSNNGTQPYQQDRIYDINGIAPSLSANKSDLIIAGDFRNDEGFRPRKNGKTCSLVTRGDESGKNPILKMDTKFRRLTPIECERLQTVPDNYTNFVSDTQRYKMLGNGWTIDVIAHIFEYLKNT